MSNNPYKKPDYKNSILNISNSLINYYNVPPHHETHPLLDGYLNKKYNHIIYLLMDGLGTNIIKKHLKESDALYKYMQKEVTSVFPPTTVAATNTVLSAKSPIETGYLGWVQYFPKEDTNLIVFKGIDFYTEKVIGDLRFKYLEYPSILKQINAYAPHVQTKQFMPSVVEKTGGNSFNEQVDRVLTFTHNNDETFSYVYWIEPDLSQHIEGTDSKAIKLLLEDLNQTFTSLISNVPDNTLVVGIADHGLTNVKSINIHDYKDITSLLIRNTSLEPRAINFFVKPDKLDIFKVVFNGHFGDIFDLYTKQELLNSGLLGPGEKHKMVDAFLGDFVGIAKAEYMFSITDKKTYKGHHAGLTLDEMMVPLIVYKK